MEHLEQTILDNYFSYLIMYYNSNYIHNTQKYCILISIPLLKSKTVWFENFPSHFSVSHQQNRFQKNIFFFIIIYVCIIMYLFGQK